MPKSTTIAVLLASLVVLANVANSDAPAADDKRDSQQPVQLSKEDQAALELGRKVLAAAEAIKRPDAPDAMKAITALGHDQRHYVMVRGWLAYQLHAERSLLEANKGRDKARFEKRVAFLEKAIRMVDLE